MLKNNCVAGNSLIPEESKFNLFTFVLHILFPHTRISPGRKSVSVAAYTLLFGGSKCSSDSRATQSPEFVKNQCLSDLGNN